MWLGVKVDRTSRPRRFGQQSAKTLPARGALQIEDPRSKTYILTKITRDFILKGKSTNLRAEFAISAF